MRFEVRTGPALAGVEYPAQGVPEWYPAAGFGVFVHWGLYSLPAFAEPWRGAVPDPYAHHSYAEWYANTIRIPGSPAQRYHERSYGPGVGYEDLADRWHPDDFDARAFVAELAAAGARYIVPVTKHHDGFCLWATETTDFNAARRGPGRDLVAELHDATRAAGLRFGVYFSGALDWHVSAFPPIRDDDELFTFRRSDAEFARYAAAQLTELIDRFAPELLWNDIDWPDAGKGADDFGVAALLRHYFARVPDGVVNDRWGVPYRGFVTREYTDASPGGVAWEETRGLGRSFGYNAQEGPEDSLTGPQLIELYRSVRARGGNLLLNVGPTAAGEIPELQLAALRELGAFLR